MRSSYVIIMDTETTGLIHPSTVPLKDQPHIIEFAAMKINYKTMKEVDRKTFLCVPPLEELEPIITKITGLTMDDLRNEESFGQYYLELCEWFSGVETLVAHNVEFDSGMLSLEMARLNARRKFPWPWKHVCTVDATRHRKGRRLKLEELYELLFNEPARQTHRAMEDVELLYKVYCALRETGEV